MKKQNTNFKKGFTIIEVVLVLAIAGLIMLMVFVALPSMQASQRDTERKTDYGLIVTAITNYASTRNGKILADDTYTSGEGFAVTENNDFMEKYANGVTDPSTGFFVITVSTPTANGAGDKISTETLNPGYVYIYKSSSCNSNGEPVWDKNLGARRYALYAYLEGAGSYCQDV